MQDDPMAEARKAAALAGPSFNAYNVPMALRHRMPPMPFDLRPGPDCLDGAMSASSEAIRIEREWRDWEAACRRIIDAWERGENHDE